MISTILLHECCTLTRARRLHFCLWFCCSIDKAYLVGDTRDTLFVITLRTSKHICQDLGAFFVIWIFCLVEDCVIGLHLPFERRASLAFIQLCGGSSGAVIMIGDWDQVLRVRVYLTTENKELADVNEVIISSHPFVIRYGHLSIQLSLRRQAFHT
ncbi:hypothetical protein CPB84DRAFT_1523400 [Gymnopilus junonius]|uniref:Uncharacterized protein n=1 Tax=Gymnopilus junonius TaxID=109634 RepID=A0A9P5NIL5_GYMJU|nr:hypothetical protein CPB84DRAFT_1523400 [Gymnopilus junonius]